MSKKNSTKKRNKKENTSKKDSFLDLLISADDHIMVKANEEHTKFTISQYDYMTETFEEIFIDKPFKNISEALCFAIKFKQENMARFENCMAEAKKEIEENFKKLVNTYSILNNACSTDEPEDHEHMVFILNKINEIDEYSKTTIEAILAIRQLFLLFSKYFEIPAITEFVHYINSSIYRYYEYEPIYRKYEIIKETLENKTETH